MQIDRSNYEIWFIDWMDGRLSNLQVERLKLFLDQNPDLKEELKDFTPVNLTPAGMAFPDKNSLKKLAADIPPSQFDYLCAASLENDLTASQQGELEEIISLYPDRKKTYDLIRKTKISPERLSYKKKSLLLKRTALQKVIRLSIQGISAAAAIALIIIVYSSIHTTISVKPDVTASDFASDSSAHVPSPAIAEERPPALRSAGSGKARGEYRKIPVITKSPLGVDHSERAIKKTSSADSSLRRIDEQEKTIIKVPVNTGVDLEKGIISNTLIASNPAINFPDAGDERSRTGKFLSKTFREKILKEKKSSDGPIQGYEIAEAGVLGLNKLFGWQMDLDRKKDANGQPKSINFRSKMLTVNVPVKKREPQP